MRYCPGNDRASGVGFPFRRHLSAAAAVVVAAGWLLTAVSFSELKTLTRQLRNHDRACDTRRARVRDSLYFFVSIIALDNRARQSRLTCANQQNLSSGIDEIRSTVVSCRLCESQLSLERRDMFPRHFSVFPRYIRSISDWTLLPRPYQELRQKSKSPSRQLRFY